jgi:membrane protease YdiL (CAAX protease family)
MNFITKPKPARILTDILMIAFFFVVPHFGLMPIYIYPVVLLFICWLYLRLFHESFNDIGFRFSDLSFKSLLVGCLLGAAYFFFNYFLLGPLLQKLLHLPPADIQDFAYVKNNLPGYLLILLIAWILAVPYEEIIFRGFIFTGIRKMFGNTKFNFIAAGFITSLLFGFYHLQQGAGGVVHAFIFGIVVTILYKLFKENLWYLIFFHSMYDTIAITAIRLGYFD